MVVLEYCGGPRTEALHRTLSKWNPRARVLVLDNASPRNRAACVTHQNARNTYVGGGIRDCLALGTSLGARYVFYIANDVEILDPLVIKDFQSVMDRDPTVALFSTSVSADSHQAHHFPWMTRKDGGTVRRVRFADLLCCLIRLDFVESFGGFPPSRGGWGYAREVAYQARVQGKKIYVNDRCAVRHLEHRAHLTTEQGVTVCKDGEAMRVYTQRHGSLANLRFGLSRPEFDETLGLGRGLARGRSKG